MGQRTSGGEFGTFDGDMLVIYSIDRRGKSIESFEACSSLSRLAYGDAN